MATQSYDFEQRMRLAHRVGVLQGHITLALAALRYDNKDGAVKSLLEAYPDIRQWYENLTDWNTEFDAVNQRIGA